VLSREEEIEAEVQRLLALYDENERRRALMSPEERAAEDRELEALLQRVTDEEEEKKRTTLRVRRAGEDDIIRLSRADLSARGFQPLFSVRRSSEDVYFEAQDGAWYRIEAYPEYVRSGAIPPPSFAAPPWKRPLSAREEALYRYAAIARERNARCGRDGGGAT
jgi:hypothetical protein